MQIHFNFINCFLSLIIVIMAQDALNSHFLNISCLMCIFKPFLMTIFWKVNFKFICKFRWISEDTFWLYLFNLLNPKNLSWLVLPHILSWEQAKFHIVLEKTYTFHMQGIFFLSPPPLWKFQLHVHNNKEAGNSFQHFSNSYPFKNECILHWYITKK